MISLNNKISLILVGCILICCVLACEGNKEHPKDEQLIQNFQNRKAEFNQLVQMFQEDRSLGRVSYDFTRTSSFFEKCSEPNGWNGKEIEVSEERLREYREFFKTLQFSAGIEGYCEKDNITFIASTEGTSISGGSSKGYAFLKSLPEKSDGLVDNLDIYQAPYGKSFVSYRHIEGNWYLYFANDN